MTRRSSVWCRSVRVRGYGLSWCVSTETQKTDETWKTAPAQGGSPYGSVDPFEYVNPRFVAESSMGASADFSPGMSERISTWIKERYTPKPDGESRQVVE